MLQAITTKFLGPTNFKGSRIKVSCDAKTIIVNWKYDIDSDENHKRAALLLLTQLGWQNYGDWVGGASDMNKKDYVFCCKTEQSLLGTEL